MKPELVLDEDEKKTRFRKFLSKKAIKEETTEAPQFIPLKVELNTKTILKVAIYENNQR